MKATELIKLLSKLPDGAEVWVSDDSGDMSLKIESLFYEEDTNKFFMGYWYYPGKIDPSIQKLTEKEM